MARPVRSERLFKARLIGTPVVDECFLADDDKISFHVEKQVAAFIQPAPYRFDLVRPNPALTENAAQQLRGEAVTPAALAAEGAFVQRNQGFRDVGICLFSAFLQSGRLRMLLCSFDQESKFILA